MMARSRAARRWAVSADSILPPRPRLGTRRTSRTRARASEVRGHRPAGVPGPGCASPSRPRRRPDDGRGCRPSACRRRRGNGRPRPGPARCWPWTGLSPPGGPGIGPLPGGWRGVRSGRRRQPTPGSVARRRRRTGGCCQPWRPGCRRRRPRPPRGRDRTVPGTSGAQGRWPDRWSRGTPVKLVKARLITSLTCP